MGCWPHPSCVLQHLITGGQPGSLRRRTPCCIRGPYPRLTVPSPPPPPCPVTDTIRGQIADVNAFVEKPDVLAYGCLCSVGERSVWCCSLEGGTCGRGCCRQRQRAVKGAPSRAQLERSN